MAIQTTATDSHLRSSQATGLVATTPFSVSTWINTTWNAGATASMVGIYGPATDTPLGAPVTAMQIGSQTGNYELCAWTWGGANLTQTATGYMTGYNGVWVFIVYTYDGTNHTLYRNGIQASTTVTTQQPGYLNQVYINGFPNSASAEVVAMQVDQYALYRRTLSATEVLTIYNAAGARHGIVNGLVCRYEFDELSQGASVSNVVDLTGNGNTLTFTGLGTVMTYAYPNTYANSNLRPVQ